MAAVVEREHRIAVGQRLGDRLVAVRMNPVAWETSNGGLLSSPANWWTAMNAPSSVRI